MANQVTKNFSNEILITAGNMTQPAVFQNWSHGSCTYGTDWVQISIGTKGFRFSSNPDMSPYGALELVGEIDVSAYDPVDIAALINTNILTEDKFSGTPTVIADTTMVQGQFTAIEFITDSVLDVSDANATVEVDALGNDITSLGDYSGQSFKAGSTIYGNFTQVQLVSGSVKCYSNLPLVNP